MILRCALVVAAIIVLSIAVSPITIKGSEHANIAASTSKVVTDDFSIAAAGDWACNHNTASTVNNIVKKNATLVLGLGDYYYSDYLNESHNPDCWFQITKPIDQKMRIAIGNHESQPPSLLKLFMNHFNLTKEYYSFNYQNVHFLALSTEIPLLGFGSEQYNFVKNDLAKAASNQNINWIIAYYHRKAYSSPSILGPFAPVRDTYHPLFDKYHVDLVLNTDMHNYQRSYPIKYNSIDATRPIITSTNASNYTNPQGRIFVIAGTAGAHFFPLYGKAPYVANQYLAHGFLDVTITNNGRTLDAKFYANDGSVKDKFTINKSRQ